MITPINILYILSSFKPKSFRLTEIAKEYLTIRDIDQKPPIVALSALISLIGDRDVSQYTREDAKLFVRHLEMRGNKTLLSKDVLIAYLLSSITPIQN